MTPDEWCAAVMVEVLKRAATLPAQAEMADIEMASHMNYGRVVGLAWRHGEGRYGRRHAIPGEQHLRTALTAEYVAMATVEQWIDTCAQLTGGEVDLRAPVSS